MKRTPSLPQILCECVIRAFHQIWGIILEDCRNELTDFALRIRSVSENKKKTSLQLLLPNKEMLFENNFRKFIEIVLTQSSKNMNGIEN